MQHALKCTGLMQKDGCTPLHAVPGQEAGCGEDMGRMQAGQEHSPGLQEEEISRPSRWQWVHLLGSHMVCKEPCNGLSFPETKLVLCTAHLCALLNCCRGATETSPSLSRREALEREALVAADAEALPTEALGQPQPARPIAPEEIRQHGALRGDPGGG